MTTMLFCSKPFNDNNSLNWDLLDFWDYLDYLDTDY